MIKTIGIDFQKMWKREDKVQACMNKEDEGKENKNISFIEKNSI